MMKAAILVTLAASTMMATPSYAQSATDVIVMRTVITSPHRTATPPMTPVATPTPAPTATPTPSPTPDVNGALWVTCGGESDICEFNGTTSVRYGAGTSFNTRTVTDTVRCSYQDFGDPAQGAAKHCEYDSRYATPSVWVYCSAYDQTCVVPGSAVVRFGANGNYFQRTVRNFIQCDLGSFGGDPAYGVQKVCQYKLTPASENTAPGTAGTITSIVVNAGIVNRCIQVAELEVYSGGVNVALATNGGLAGGSPPYSAESNVTKANDGVRPAGYPNIYHSSCSDGDTLSIEFAKPVKVDMVRIYGRADGSHERDVYGYKLYSHTTVVSQGQIDATSGVGDSIPN